MKTIKITMITSHLLEPGPNKHLCSPTVLHYNDIWAHHIKPFGYSTWPNFNVCYTSMNRAVLNA